MTVDPILTAYRDTLMANLFRPSPTWVALTDVTARIERRREQWQAQGATEDEIDALEALA